LEAAFPFLVSSPPGIVTCLVLWRFGKEPRQEKPQQAADIKEILKLFKNRLMWVCGGIQYVRLSVMMGIAFWLPSLLVEEKGLSLQLAGIIIAMQSLLSAPSNVIGGYVSDRLKNPVLVIAVSLAVLMITTLLIAALDNIALVIFVIAVNSVFVQMYFGPLFSVPVEVLGERTGGTATGFSNLFANIGSFSFTWLLGMLKTLPALLRADSSPWRFLRRRTSAAGLLARMRQMPWRRALRLEVCCVSSSFDKLRTNGERCWGRTGARIG
jgi:sugar phosphate permease